MTSSGLQLHSSKLFKSFVGDELFFNRQPLSQWRNTVWHSSLYRYFNGICLLVPPVQTLTARSRYYTYSESTHLHSVHIPLIRWKYRSYIFPQNNYFAEQTPESIFPSSLQSYPLQVLHQLLSTRNTFIFAPLALCMYVCTKVLFSKPLTWVAFWNFIGWKIILKI